MNLQMVFLQDDLHILQNFVLIVNCGFCCTYKKKLNMKHFQNIKCLKKTADLYVAFVVCILFAMQFDFHWVFMTASSSI